MRLEELKTQLSNLGFDIVIDDDDDKECNCDNCECSDKEQCCSNKYND